MKIILSVNFTISENLYCTKLYLCIFLTKYLYRRVPVAELGLPSWKGDTTAETVGKCSVTGAQASTGQYLNET